MQYLKSSGLFIFALYGGVDAFLKVKCAILISIKIGFNIIAVFV